MMKFFHKMLMNHFAMTFFLLSASVVGANCGGSVEDFQDDSQVNSLKNVTPSKIASGGNVTCGIFNVESPSRPQTILCWGQNITGQHFSFDTYLSKLVILKAFVSDGEIVDIAVGKDRDNHACAVFASGKVKCWGSNEFGQLGNNSVLAKPDFVLSDAYDYYYYPLTSATQVSLGLHHSCALTQQGKVKCWGDNSKRQLGVGATKRDSRDPVPFSIKPVEIPDLDHVVQISAGGDYTCALTDENEVKCWGDLTGRNLVPDLMTLLAEQEPIGGISAGVNHACAWMNNGSIKCFGNNWYGQLGNGKKETSFEPVAVSGLPKGATVFWVSAGDYHTCALAKDDNDGMSQEHHSIFCWGSNFKGQLGDNDDNLLVAVTTPVKVVGLEGKTVFQLTAGLAHSCAYTNDNSRWYGQYSVWCWGDNSSLQLGGDGYANKQSYAYPISAE